MRKSPVYMELWPSGPNNMYNFSRAMDGRPIMYVGTLYEVQTSSAKLSMWALIKFLKLSMYNPIIQSKD